VQLHTRTRKTHAGVSFTLLIRTVQAYFTHTAQQTVPEGFQKWKKGREIPVQAY